MFYMFGAMRMYNLGDVWRRVLLVRSMAQTPEIEKKMTPDVRGYNSRKIVWIVLKIDIQVAESVENMHRKFQLDSSKWKKVMVKILTRPSSSSVGNRNRVVPRVVAFTHRLWKYTYLNTYVFVLYGKTTGGIPFKFEMCIIVHDTIGSTKFNLKILKLKKKKKFATIRESMLLRHTPALTRTSLLCLQYNIFFAENWHRQ